MWTHWREICILSLWFSFFWSLIQLSSNRANPWRNCKYAHLHTWYHYQVCSLVKSSSTGRSDETGVSHCLAQIRGENLHSMGHLSVFQAELLNAPDNGKTHLLFVFCNCAPLGVDVLLHLCLRRWVICISSLSVKSYFFKLTNNMLLSQI